MRHALLPATLLIAILVGLPHVDSAAEAFPMADGKTPTLTPQGTWIIPPPGAPLLIIEEDPADVAEEHDATWTSPPLTNEAAEPATALASTSSCTPYQAGWYETNSAGLHGGHAGIIPQNLPANSQYYCAGKGMGYTTGVSFGATSWVQAGLATFAGETGAKWFCQANNFGSKTTHYGTANAYGNGATVYTWFARDSGGTWRTYRYDTGPYSVQLPCSISRGASGNLQVYGEIQGATSTQAPMGPWEMFDLRYLPSTGSQWYAPSQVQASYPQGMTCPPYGAGTVSSGVIIAGSGKACTTGTSAYPN